LYWPAGGWTGGKQLNQVTAHVDLLPTLLKACKIENSFGVEFNGIALNDLIANPSQKLDRYLITEAKVNKRESPFNSGVVLKDDWRLVGGTELFDLKDDFAQTNNIIDENSEVKTDLENHYTEWYNNSKDKFDEIITINIGADKTELFCMDLYAGPMTKEKTKVVWNQKGVLKADYYRGFWMLDIEETGKYEVKLRRWPETLNEPILKGPHKSKELKISGAQLIVEGNEIKKEATSSQKEIVFEIDLKKGEQPFQAEFVDNKGETFSAYYVYIKKK
jgi:hypothetical protein